MNSLPNLRNSEPTVENYYDSIPSNCNYSEEYNLATCNSEKPLYNKTILVVGDSFRKASIQYVSKLYKKSVFIDKHIYNQNNQDHIKQYNPNIVIYEVVERASVNLLNLYELMEKKS